MQPPDFQPNALRKGQAVRPLYVLNHILDNNPETYDFRNLSIPEPKSYEDVQNVPWPPKPNVGVPNPVPNMTYCQHAGQPLVCTLKGLKVLDNPFWGTKKEQDPVTLTVVWITLPIIWAIDVRKSLLKHPKGCSPKLAIANCKMASYDDDYSGNNPFGCLDNFPYYGPIPYTAVGGSVSAILGNFGVPGLNALAGWTKEEVALFGYLGDYIVNGDEGTKYSRKANFTCLLE